MISSVKRLLEFYAVESTYLAMFLVLGALGLGVGMIASAVAMIPAFTVSQSRPPAGLFLTVTACGALCMLAAILISLRRLKTLPGASE